MGRGWDSEADKNLFSSFLQNGFPDKVLRRFHCIVLKSLKKKKKQTNKKQKNNSDKLL